MLPQAVGPDGPTSRWPQWIHQAGAELTRVGLLQRTVLHLKGSSNSCACKQESWHSPGPGDAQSTRCPGPCPRVITFPPSSFRTVPGPTTPYPGYSPALPGVCCLPA